LESSDIFKAALRRPVDAVKLGLILTNGTIVPKPGVEVVTAVVYETT